MSEKQFDRWVQYDETTSTFTQREAAYVVRPKGPMAWAVVRAADGPEGQPVATWDFFRGDAENAALSSPSAERGFRAVCAAA